VATSFRRSSRARQVVKAAARPGLDLAARAIAQAIPQHVPVHHGVAVTTYRPEVRDAGDEAQVLGFGPFWHLLEYGTAHSPAYRVIERAVRSVGLEWRAQ